MKTYRTKNLQAQYQIHMLSGQGHDTPALSHPFTHTSQQQNGLKNKHTSLQPCDLSQQLSGTFRCVIAIHVVPFDVIIATVQLKEATEYNYNLRWALVTYRNSNDWLINGHSASKTMQTREASWTVVCQLLEENELMVMVCILVKSV